MNYRLYNDTLCPDIWQNGKMNPEVSKTLLKIANDFVEEQLKENDINVKISDVVVIGSLTNYNWTPYSDIDLHIVVDFAQLDMPEEQATLMFNAIKASWNKSHNITIKGHDVEVYVQGTNEKNHTESEYSVMTGKWLKVPKKNKPVFDKEHIKKKYAELRAKIEQALKDGDEESLRKILEKLYMIRQAGLDKKGEFSEENIVFKILRAQGYLDKIKDHANKLYDKEVTISEIA
jgi:predicted nucleotidyltransferase